MANITYAQISDALTVKALKDPAFRKELVADPVATFEKYLKQPVKSKIVVHENSPTETHFVLPPAIGDGDLSEDDLEKVAGGTIPITWEMLTGTMQYGPTIKDPTPTHGW